MTDSPEFDRFPSLPDSEGFNFSCVPDECDIRCCTTGHPLVLSPFEIQRISRLSGIPFDTLEDDFFEESHDPLSGFPLMTINREKGCGFLRKRGCSVYEARPLVCRLFPLGKLYDDGFRYVLLSKNACAGFSEQARQSVKGYREAQDTALYDAMWEVWVDFINRMEQEGMVDNSLFRSVFGLMIYNSDLPPAGLAHEDAGRLSSEELFRLRLKAAADGLPRLKEIFLKQASASTGPA